MYLLYVLFSAFPILSYACIAVYFPFGILQWYRSIDLAQPVVYDIGKEIIQGFAGILESNSSAVPKTKLEKGPKYKGSNFEGWN